MPYVARDAPVAFAGALLRTSTNKRTGGERVVDADRGVAHPPAAGVRRRAAVTAVREDRGGRARRTGPAGPAAPQCSVTDPRT